MKERMSATRMRQRDLEERRERAAEVYDQLRRAIGKLGKGKYGDYFRSFNHWMDLYLVADADILREEGFLKEHSPRKRIAIEILYGLYSSSEERMFFARDTSPSAERYYDLGLAAKRAANWRQESLKELKEIKSNVHAALGWGTGMKGRWG